MKVVERSRPVVRLLRSRMRSWRQRPVLAVLAVAFVAVGALRMLASYGTGWDSFLGGAGWVLLWCVILAALVGDPRSNRSE